MTTFRAIVTADHKNKTAKLSLLDEKGRAPLDQKGYELRNMQFPYSHLTDYDFLFQSLGENPDGTEDYHFKDFDQTIT